MITAMLLATALLQPVGDTTWLRTEGAEVMWESDQNVCALFIFQESDAVGFFWNKTGPTSIVFFNEQWDFSPSETRVAVRNRQQLDEQEWRNRLVSSRREEKRSDGSHSLPPRRELIEQGELSFAPPPGRRFRIAVGQKEDAKTTESRGDLPKALEVAAERMPVHQNAGHHVDEVQQP